MTVVVGAAGSNTAAILVELGIAIGVLSILVGLARRIGLSAIPFFLLAGLFVGEGTVVELEATRPFLEAGATVGAVLLLFLLGLEFSGNELVTALRTNRNAGILDLVANFVPGYAVGVVLGWTQLESVLLGGITYISSSGIVARLLDELGRMGNRETPTVLSILVFEDLAMAIFLPVVAGFVAGGSATAIGIRVSVALVAVAVAFVVAIRLGPRLSKMGERLDADTVLFGALGTVLLVAGLAEFAQVSAGVGAFLVGVAMSGRVAEITESSIPPLRDFFAGLFFLFFGVQTDPADLPPVLPAAIALVGITLLTKFGVGWWAARRAGIGAPGRVRAGTVLGPRGEFSIVIAGIATAGGLEPRIAAIAAAYVFGTAIVGAIATRLAERKPVGVPR